MVVSTVAGLVPLVGIVELARILLPAASGAGVDASRAWVVVWTSVAALLVRLATVLGSSWLSHVADLDLSIHLRRLLVARLGRVPLAWFTERNSGTVKKAVQDDVAALHHLVAHSVMELTAAITLPAVVACYLFVVSPPLALVTLVPLALGLVGFRISMRGAAALYRDYDAGLAELAAATVENTGGIAEIKTFGATGQAHRRLAEVATRFGGFNRAWMRHSAFGMLLMELALTPALTLVLVLGAGVWMLRAGQITGPDLVPFLVLGLAMTAPVTVAGYAARELREATEAARRIQRLLAEPELPEPAAPGPAPDAARVELHNVSFSYSPDASPVLHDIDLVLEPGTVTTLVGHSGSGKLDPGQAAAPLLGPDGRADHPRRGGPARAAPGLRPPPGRAGRPGYLPVQRQPGPESQIGPARGTDDDLAGRPPSPTRTRSSNELPDGYDAGRRARRSSIRRPAPADRRCPGAAQGRADPGPRRGHLAPRRRERAPGPAARSTA